MAEVLVYELGWRGASDKPDNFVRVYGDDGTRQLTSLRCDLPTAGADIILVVRGEFVLGNEKRERGTADALVLDLSPFAISIEQEGDGAWRVAQAPNAPEEIFVHCDWGTNRAIPEKVTRGDSVRRLE